MYLIYMFHSKASTFGLILNQDPDTEAAQWNSVIFLYVTYTVCMHFPQCGVKMSQCREKGLFSQV